MADWLCREAKRHNNRARVTSSGEYFIEKAGMAFHCHRQPDELPESQRGGCTFATISIHPRKPWVLLEISPDIQTAPARTNSVIVIVSFRYDRKLDVGGRDEREKFRKRKQMRQILRKARSEGRLSSHVMCIDAHSSVHAIRQQLAVFLAQENIYDESTEKLLGLRSKDPLSRRVGSDLVKNFIDPIHPGSFGSYKKILRRDVAGPQEARLAQETYDDDYVVASELTENDRKKVRQLSITRNRPEDDYSVRRAARELGTHWRTLYRQIAGREQSLSHDKFGRIRIPADMLEALRIEKEQKKQRKTLTSLVVERGGIQPASVRRQINRALKRGKTLEQIAREYLHPTGTISPRDHGAKSD